ncbi:LysM peptidoglycan-binding domain-containing protein [Dermabacteraceae bacterium CCM 9520]
MRKLKAASAALLLVALLFGIPAALLALYGNPFPTSLPSAAEIKRLFTSTDTAAFFIFVAVWVSWIAWATFAFSTLHELIYRLKATPAPNLKGLSLQQGAASLLLATIAAGITSPAALAAPNHEEIAHPAVTIQAPQKQQAPETAPETAPEAPANQAKQETKTRLTITVQAGDSAWSLAEQHLGNGQKWKELVEANLNKIQPDGKSLKAGETPYLEPGWKLEIPGTENLSEAEREAAETAANQNRYEEVTVQEGESIYSLAKQHLGSADKWEAILDASTDFTQPNGAKLTDPDQVKAGWKLRIPQAAQPGTPASTEAETATPAPAEAAPSEAEALPTAPADAASSETEAETAAPAPAEAETLAPAPVQAETAKESSEALPSAPETPSHEETPTQEAPAPTETPATPESTIPLASDTETQQTETNWLGISSIFASSVLMLLVSKRIHTLRKRRKGQKIPAAAKQLENSQVQLARIKDATVLGFVDRALRTLSALQMEAGKTLPHIRMARITDSHLELYAAEPHELPAPFEATSDPSTWFLSRNSELAIDEEIEDIIAPYPALVTIGQDEEDGQILVDLEHLAALGIHAPSSISVPVIRALTVALATSQWADDISITAVGICSELETALDSGRITYADNMQDLLEDLEIRLEADQKTLTAIGHDSAQQARSDADTEDPWAPEVIIIGTDITLSEEDRLRKIVTAKPQIAVAVISKDEDARLSDWYLHISSVERARLEPLGLEIRPQHLTDSDYSNLLALLGTSSELEETNEPSNLRALPTPAEVVSNEPILTKEFLDAAPQLPEDPFIQLIGPIEIHSAKGPVESNKQARYTEIAAHIALKPGTCDTDFQADLWPGKQVGKQTRATSISKIRRWFGKTDAGESYLPRANKVNGSYAFLDQVQTDWHLVQATANALDSASNEDLANALKLVRGKPFQDAGRNRYSWALTTHGYILEAVTDIAHELARRALEHNDTETALWATGKGLETDPLIETLWIDRLTAAAATPELHKKLTNQLYALAEQEDYDISYDVEQVAFTDKTTTRLAI